MEVLSPTVLAVMSSQDISMKFSKENLILTLPEVSLLRRLRESSNPCWSRRGEGIVGVKSPRILRPWHLFSEFIKNQSGSFGHFTIHLIRYRMFYFHYSKLFNFQINNSE